MSELQQHAAGVVRRIYVQTHGIPTPKWVVMDPAGRTHYASHVDIRGASECIYDDALGKFVVSTTAELVLTP